MTVLQVQRHGEVTEILLASPEEKNTFDSDLCDRVLELLDQLEQDHQTRALIIGNTGSIFSAGGSLDMLGEISGQAQNGNDQAGLTEKLRQNMCVVERLWDFPKPIVAAINGPCVGAGIGWIATCDVRMASDSSFFDTMYLNLGLGTDFGVSWLLGQAMGGARALDWVLRPRRISANQAEAHGLIGAVHSPNDLLNAAREAATLLTRTAPEVIQGMRQDARGVPHLSLSQALDRETERFVAALPGARLPVSGR